MCVSMFESQYILQFSKGVSILELYQGTGGPQTSRQSLKKGRSTSLQLPTSLSHQPLLQDPGAYSHHIRHLISNEVHTTARYSQAGRSATMYRHA